MKKRINPLLIIATALFGAVLYPATVASAASLQPAKQLAICESKNTFLGFSPWYACLPGGENGEPRIESLDDIFLIVLPLLETLVLAAAFVAAAMIFYNLIQFIIARGNAGKASTAMTGIRDAVIGFIIALLSVAIVNFIANSLIS